MAPPTPPPAAAVHPHDPHILIEKSALPLGQRLVQERKLGLPVRLETQVPVGSGDISNPNVE